MPRPCARGGFLGCYSGISFSFLFLREQLNEYSVFFCLENQCSKTRTPDLQGGGLHFYTLQIGIRDLHALCCRSPALMATWPLLLATTPASQHSCWRVTKLPLFPHSRTYNRPLLQLFRLSFRL